MRLFWKIFSAVVLSFLLATFWTAYTLISQQIEQSTNHLFENWDAISSLVGQEVEISQLENQWPFESLHNISRRESFLLWWIVQDDGRIRMANDVAFIGSHVGDYFPPDRRRPHRQAGFIDNAARIGVIVRPLQIPAGKLALWLGFSTQAVVENHRRAMLNVTASAFVLLVILGVAVYGSVRYFLRPIPALITAIDRMGHGDLDSRVKIMSADELGRVATAFNEMAVQLRRTTVSRDYMDKIVTSMIDPLVVVDADGLVQTVNPATAELLGYSLSELPGKPFASLFPPEGAPAFDPTADAEHYDEKGAMRAEGQFLAKHGKLVPVLLAFSQMLQVSQHGPLVVCVARDISERKEAERVREELILELQEALSQVKTLKGLIPICAGCKKIRDDQGYWSGVESYLRRHSAAEFTHSLCPTCIKELYPDLEET